MKLNPHKLFLSNFKYSLSGVDILSVNINKNLYLIKEFYSILSYTEKQQVDKFYFEKDKKAFIIRKGVLRCFLSYYLQKLPSKINFGYEQNQKPLVKSKNSVYFNISHSYNQVVYAFSKLKPIGIDIEYYCTQKVNGENLAKKYFSEYENHIIQSLPLHLRQKKFFEIWTIKESYLKAIGVGLSQLENLTLSSLEEGKKPRLHLFKQELKQWNVFQLDIAKHYVCAITI